MSNKNTCVLKMIFLTVYLTISLIPMSTQAKSIDETNISINKLATEEEAKALFNWAMTFLKVNGRDIAYQAFNQTDGKFTDRDLYVFCLDYNKTWKVMGANPLLVGLSARDKRDFNDRILLKNF